MTDAVATNPLGIAIWGAGWVAGAHVRAYHAAQAPGARIVAVGSRRRESAEVLIAQHGISGARVYTDYAQLLADPDVDAVSLCTPNGQHATEAIAAARAGKHLLIEKPVATNAEDFNAVLRAVDAADVTAAACFIQRWNPLVNTLRIMRAQGDFGRVFLAHADYWFGRERPEWMRHAASAGSSFLVGAIHAVDSLRYILGEDVVEVDARGAEQGGAYHYPAAVQALVRYAAGGVGAISSSLVGHTGYMLNIELAGTEGSARNDQVFLKRIPNMQSWMTLPVRGPASGDVSQLPFPQLVEDFLGAVRAGVQPRTHLASTRNTHEVCFAVDRTLETGRPVALPLG